MPGAAYIVFDGDNDGWAYRYMNGWTANRNIDFKYQNAHDLDTMTGRAQNGRYVNCALGFLNPNFVDHLMTFVLGVSDSFTDKVN